MFFFVWENFDKHECEELELQKCTFKKHTFVLMQNGSTMMYLEKLVKCLCGEVQKYLHKNVLLKVL